ncbi:hypothetical protein HZB00_02795 [Candidatus Woesearchaeota archaeon]|nr:hypothetical protein [Candidatus Woesearchaeota archaeon]
MKKSSVLIFLAIVIALFIQNIIQIVIANNATIAYASNTGTYRLNSSKIRQWNASGTGWGSEIELNTTNNAIQWIVMKYSNLSQRQIIVVETVDRFLHSYVCDPTARNNCSTTNNWNLSWRFANVTDQMLGATTYRPFDVEFETNTSNAMVVYSVNNSATTCDLGYKILKYGDYNLTAQAENCLDDTAATTDITYAWPKLARNMSNNELMFVGFDVNDSDIRAFVWNGSAWGNIMTIASNATALAVGGVQALAVAYDQLGRALVVGSNGTTGNVTSFLWDGAAWRMWNDFDIDQTDANDLAWIQLKAEPIAGSINITAVFTDSGSNLGTAWWNGTNWTVTPNIDLTVDTINTRAADFAWNQTGHIGQLVWDTDGTAFIFNNTLCNPHCRSTGGRGSRFNGTGAWVSIATNPTSADREKMVGARLNANFTIGSFYWNNTNTLNLTNYGDLQIGLNTTATTFERYSLAFEWTPTYPNYAPKINITAPTDANNTHWDRDFILINVSISDANTRAVIFDVFNATAAVNITSLQLTGDSTNYTLNISHLRPDTYFFNVSVNDTNGIINVSEKRQQTLVGCGVGLLNSFTLTTNLHNETFDATGVMGTICSGPGLSFGKSNITLNCNNFQITGRSIDQRGLNIYGINGTSVMNVSIQNCVINMTEYGIFFNQVNISKINNTFIDYTNRTGINLLFSAMNNITNTYINANGTNDSSALALDTNAALNFIYNTTLKSRGADALKIINSVQNNISNSEIRTAHATKPAVNLTIASNNLIVWSNITGPIGIQLDSSNNNIFAANNFSNSNASILLGTSTGNWIIANTFLLSGTARGIDSYVTGLNYNITIEYNNFSNSGTGDVISLAHIQNITLRNNVLTSTSTGTGISILNTSNLILLNNTIYPSSGMGISLINISVANISYLLVGKTTGTGALFLRGLNNVNFTNITLLKSTLQVNASDYTAAASTNNTWINILFNDSLAVYFNGMNATFYNTSFATENGSVFYWNFSVIDALLNTTNSLFIKNNNITLLSDNINTLNKSAQLTLLNIDKTALGLTTPRLFHGYTLCPSTVCSNQVYDAINLLLTGNVTSFFNNTFTVGEGSTLSCSWSDAVLNITFGTPGSTITQGNTLNASRNYNYSTDGVGSASNGSDYNVTAAATNTVKVNITLRGEHLYETVGGNILNIGNISWGSNTTTANSTGGTALDNMTYPGNPLNLTGQTNPSHRVAVTEPAGSSVWFRFWLNTPASQPAGLYRGNYTMTCEDSGSV